MNPPELLLAPTSFPPVPPPSEGGMGGVRNDVQTSHITTDSPLSPLSSHPSATKWPGAQFDPGQKFGAIPFHEHGPVLMEVELQHFVCCHFAFAAAVLNLVIAQF